MPFSDFIPLIKIFPSLSLDVKFLFSLTFLFPYYTIHFSASAIFFLKQKGVIEICRFLRPPLANQFLDWVSDIVEKIFGEDKRIRQSPKSKHKTKTSSDVFTTYKKGKEKQNMITITTIKLTNKKTSN